MNANCFFFKFAIFVANKDFILFHIYNISSRARSSLVSKQEIIK